MLRLSRIDLARRAEIGREKSARTRGQILAAARELYVVQTPASITVDAIVANAEIAKGTFYYHFADLAALEDALAEEIVRDLEDLIRPQRATRERGLMRVAVGFRAFLEHFHRDRQWGAFVARRTIEIPKLANVVRDALLADLKDARTNGELCIDDLQFAADLVIAFWTATVLRAQEPKAKSTLAEDATAALLRALGKTPSAAARMAVLSAG